MNNKVEINIDKKTYTLKEDITIGEYQLLQSKSNTFTTDYDFLLFLSSVLYGCPIELLRKVSKTEFLYAAKYAVELFNEDDETFYKSFEFNGVKYGFEPELNNMVTGMFVDLEHFIKEGTTKNLHYIMAILYRELKYMETRYGKDYYEIDDYDGFMMDKRAGYFKDLPMKYVKGAISFFLTLSQVSLYDLMNYLEGDLEAQTKMNQMLKDKLQTMKDLMRPMMDGVGMASFNLRSITI